MAAIMATVAPSANRRGHMLIMSKVRIIRRHDSYPIPPFPFQTPC